MSYAESSVLITVLIPIPVVHPGSPSSATCRIVYGVLICFDVNLPYCEPTGFSSMDQFTRRIIGFGVQRGVVDGLALCRMFNRAIRGQAPLKYSSDHDPLYRFQQWQANLR